MMDKIVMNSDRLVWSFFTNSIIKNTNSDSSTSSRNADRVKQRPVAHSFFVQIWKRISTRLYFLQKTTILLIFFLTLTNFMLESWAAVEQQHFAVTPARRLLSPRPIQLNKCCLHGEYLQESKSCMVGSSELWIPLIYLFKNKTYHTPHGSSPKSISFIDNVLPIAKARPSKMNASRENNTTNNNHSNNATNTNKTNNTKNNGGEDNEDDVNCSLEDLELFTGNQNLVIFSNGLLYLAERSIFVPPHRYCVDQQAALVCFPEKNGQVPTLKLKKCCGTHGVYDELNKSCHIGKNLQQEKLKLSGLEEDKYETHYGFPYCQDEKISEKLINIQDNKTNININKMMNNSSSSNSNHSNYVGNHYILAGNWLDGQFNKNTGYLYLPRYHLNLSSSEYCLEHVRAITNVKKVETTTPTSNNNNKNNDKRKNLNNSILISDEIEVSGTVKVITCFHHLIGSNNPIRIDGGISLNNYDEDSIYKDGHIIQIDSSDSSQYTILRIGVVISVIFLAGTLIASYLMPSIHHVLHWRCQIYYVFCLFMGKLLLAYTLFRKPEEELETVLCQLVASVMHFFFLAAFFWLNTMCFNIWWTFRDFRPSSLERNQEMLRLRLYSAYAWGIPLIIAAIAACVNLAPDSSLLRPGFGEDRCWFTGEPLPIFAYLFGPMGILLCINIILFVSTTHQLTCGLWKRDDVKSTTERTALGKVCVKLVVVMGVTWIADVMSWLIGGPNAAWFFTDLINAIQGVFIFLVVGCQPQVWSACKRFCCPRSRQEITNTTNGVQHSSSSQGLPSVGSGGGSGGFTTFGGTADITQNTSIGHSTTFSVGASNDPVTISTITSCAQSTTAISAPTTISSSNYTTNRPKVPMETVC